jgi:hypothetical protein
MSGCCVTRSHPAAVAQTFSKRIEVARYLLLIARARDAADVPITMTFGKNFLINFSVTTEELDTSSIGALADFNEIRALSAKRQNKVSQLAV